jgi:hypothetical protein
MNVSRCGLNELPNVADQLMAAFLYDNNVRSLSEMSYETIAEYFAQIDCVGRLFFS